MKKIFGDPADKKLGRQFLFENAEAVIRSVRQWKAGFPDGYQER